MKTFIACATAATLLTLSACGGTEEKTTVIHERPVVVAPQASPTSTSVEHMCKNGYDNASRSCY